MRQKKKIYPINYLRDVAILNVVTTHYINLDMDLWPTSGKWGRMARRHRVSALEAAGPSGAGRQEIGDHSTCFPALRQHAFDCEEDEELHDGEVENESEMERRAVAFVPDTKATLRSCYDSKQCSYANPSQNRHVDAAGAVECRSA